jgi:hypothetical protein
MQGPDFVPVVADAGSGAAAIEIEFGSASVCVREGVDLALLGKLLRLLKAMNDPRPLRHATGGVRVPFAALSPGRDLRPRGLSAWRPRPCPAGSEPRPRRSSRWLTRWPPR